jgi:hypothetical protein
MAAVLKTRQLIPPLTARTPAGRTVQAWDYKQKKSLVIAFLRAEDLVPQGASAAAPRSNFVADLAAHAAELRSREAVVLVVLPGAIPASLGGNLPEEIIVAADTSGRSHRAFLGEDAFSTAGLVRTGVFVTDRFGELCAQWIARDASELPAAAEILSWLSQLQIACEECGAPHWPAE